MKSFYSVEVKYKKILRKKTEIKIKQNRIKNKNE